jgi:hypothetical protein
MNDIAKLSAVDPNYKFVVLTLINTVVAFAYLIFACYLLIRVQKLFGLRDMPILISIVSITLSLATLITFWAISVAMQF